MVLVNGEKFACEACIRGHRVSSCNHVERDLHHINKKGRPVSQCNQCRSMRKSRSAHHQCDCGKATYKCPHLSEMKEGHSRGCCCGHGEPCSCHSLKNKEPLLDTVLESDESDHETGLSRMSSKQSHDSRRLANTDAPLTFDQNGHHKPTYKHAKLHETTGPYQLARVHSHDNTRLTNRSVDNLLHDAKPSGVSGLAMVDNEGLGLDLRLTRSETASPHLDGPLPLSMANTGLTLDLSNVQYDNVAESKDFFGTNTPDFDQPLFSAPLSAPPVDWSIYEGLEFAGKATDSFAHSTYSQPRSFGGLDTVSSEQLPAMTTTSNSGTVSEAGEFILGTNDVFGLGSSLRSSTGSLPLELGQDNRSMGDLDFGQYKFSDMASSDLSGGMASSDLLGVSGVPDASNLDEASILAMTVPLADSGVFSASDGENAFWLSDPNISGWETS